MMNISLLLVFSLTAGITMYKYLPRHTFGYIQSKLFPKYFMLGLVLSTTTLVTFILDNPVTTWNFQQKLQVSLCVCVCVCVCMCVCVMYMYIYIDVKERVCLKFAVLSYFMKFCIDHASTSCTTLHTQLQGQTKWVLHVSAEGCHK